MWWFLFSSEGELQPLSGGTNGEGALGNGIHIVAADLKVGDSIDAPELDGSYVICFCGFLFSAYRRIA